jgi:Rieske Fe-S protein
MMAIAGPIDGWGVLQFLSHPTTPDEQTVYGLGPTANSPLDSRTIITEARVDSLHTEERFQAMSAQSPRLGCQVEPWTAGYACPCRGSRFDLQGKTVPGPADRPLPKMAVLINHE